MVLTLDSLARGHLGSWDLHLNKLGKRPPGNGITKFQATVLISGPEEVSVCIFYLCISMVRT